MKKSRSVLVVAVSLAAVVLTSTTAQGAPAKGNRTVVACVDKKSGDLRVVSKAKKCDRGETVLKWKKKRTGKRAAAGTVGPAGAPGRDGRDGVDGIDGIDGAIGPMGPAGPAGPVGPAGSDGLNGVDGANGVDGTVGPEGPQGPPGPAGAEGAVGPAGPPGPQGPAGTGTGTVLASSSGLPGSLTTVVGGLTGTVTVLPLSGSDSLSGVTPVGPLIDLTPMPGQRSMLQLIPSDTTLKSITARFSTTTAMSLIGTTLHVRAQLYTSSGGDNVLSPVPGSTCTMAPSLTGVVAIGTVGQCTVTGLNIPITAGTTAALVFSAESTGVTLVNTLNAQMSGSIQLN
ncbi:exosporium glycoprotein BclB-related protein [Nocardioides alcanivorans]|uniref:exosporium glycoprotein BclB-related protein n=1 Tax=Nocardioides alcanivorans TaxID=2897352 RepID=UPI0024B22B8D|nr:exosporium glycoprotein BclB-related protein [Nocardioides alcanivorans]